MIKIRNIEIGEKEPCFIIAEVGINYNSDFNIAKKLIDTATDAGCDAVKFQTYKVDHLYSKKAGKIDWEDKDKEYSYDIYEANKSFELPFEWIPKLMNYCNKKNIIFLSSVWDEPSTDYLDEKGIEAFKIGSSALTNIPLINYVAKKKKPMIISIGGANINEIEDAVNAIKKFHNKIAILHCHLNYPTKLKDTNINIVSTLKEKFPDLVIGYSDHTEHPYIAPVAAVAKGAKIVEKHITLNKKMKGPDHFFALEPKELKLMVAKIREIEKKMKKGEKIDLDSKVFGSGEIKVDKDEEYLRNFAFTTIIAIKDIKKGEKLSEDNIRVLRPGKIKRGIEPKFYKQIIGKKAVKKIIFGKAVDWNDFIEIRKAKHQDIDKIISFIIENNYNELDITNNTIYYLFGGVVKGVILFKDAGFDTEFFDDKTVKLIDIVIDKKLSREEIIRNTKLILDFFIKEMKNTKFIQCKLDSRKTVISQVLQDYGFKIVSQDITFIRETTNISNIEHDYSVSSCTEKDVESLYKISKEAYTTTRFHNDVNIPKELADEMQATWIKNCYKENLADEIIVVKKDKDICGYVACKKNSKIARIVLIAVDKNFRGKGIGSILIQECLKWCKKNQCKFLAAGTQLNNEIAIQFYQKIGFKLQNSVLSFHKWL